MDVDIFVKPGCVNNEKQIKMLESKGHTVHVKNIFTYPWTEDFLLHFFEGHSLPDILNKNAPRLTSGQVTMEELMNTNVLQEMIKDNYLIRRPLLHSEGKYGCGFDSALATLLMEQDDVSEVLNCPKPTNPCE